jgi:hypothetical protein
MLVILKIPMVYLAVVVWWAIRAEPRPGGGGSETAPAFVPLTPCGWDEWKRQRSSPSSGRPRPRRPSPHGTGVRPVRRSRVGTAA